MNAPTIDGPAVPEPADSAAPGVTVRQQRFALAMVTLVLALNMADRNILLIVLEPIKREFLLSDKQVGLLSGFTFGLTYAAASLPMGVLADRVNRARLLAAVLFVWSGATTLAAAAQGFLTLLATRLMVGASEAGGAPTSLGLIAQYYEPKHRPAAISLYNIGVPIGACTSLALGGLVVAHWGWRAGFLIAGLPGVIVAAIVFFVLRDPRRKSATAAAPAGRRPGMGLAVRTMFARPTLFYLATGVTMMAMASSAVVNWLVPFLMREHHLPVQQAGLLMAASFGLGALGLAAAGAFSHRIRDLDPRYAVYFAMGVAALALTSSVFFLLAPSFILTVAGLAVLGTFGYTHVGPVYAAMLNVAPEDVRGSIVAILQVLANLVGYGVGTLLVGALSDFYGGAHSLRWALLSVMPFYCVAIALLFAASRRIRADLATAGAENQV